MPVVPTRTVERAVVSAGGPGAAGKPVNKGGPRQPIHVGIAFGMVAGVYAASLALVSGFQADTEAQAAAAKAPAANAAAQMVAAHDELDARITAAEGRFNGAVTDYQAVMDRISANQKQVASLTAKLKKISGSASKLKVPTPVVVTSVSSGGGGGGGGGGGSRIQVITVTRTVSSGSSHATTSASGKP
jgi:hypothetical protein